MAGKKRAVRKEKGGAIDLQHLENAGKSKGGYQLEPAYLEIGRRLRWLRLQKNVSQQRVAEALHYTAGHIGLIEKGRSRLNVTDLLRLAWLYGVDPLVVVDGIDPKDCVRAEELREKKLEAARKRLATLRLRGNKLGGKEKGKP